MPHPPTFIRRLLRPALVPFLLLGAALLLAGCADHTRVDITVQPGGAWSGTAVLAWERALAGDEHDLLAARTADILARNGIRSTAALNQAEPGAALYTLRLNGDDASALAPLLINARTAAESLDSPVSVVFTGDVMTGEELVVTLPASPGAGLGWMVADGTSETLKAEDSILGTDRQTLLLRASADGPAELHLAYIDLARPDILPSRSVRLTGTALGLSGLLRAVSLSEPAEPPREPAPGSPDALLPSAPGAPAGAVPDAPSGGCSAESCAPEVRPGSLVDFTIPVVDVALVSKGGVQTCDLPKYQGFEAATIHQTGWTRVISNTVHTWKIAEDGTSHSGLHYAIVTWDVRTQDEVLLSPAFTADWAELRFFSRGSPFWCRDTYDNCDLKVWLVRGAWGGGDDVLLGKADDTWTVISAWWPMTIDLTRWLEADVPARVAFEYTGRNGAEVGLDDVTIAGGCDGGFYTSFNNTGDDWFAHSGVWYTGAEYCYTYGLEDHYSTASYSAKNYANFIYSARLWRSGCESCAHFIVFRGTPAPQTAAGNWYNEYKLHIARDRSCSVWKRLEGGTAIALKGWTVTTAINQGDAWNTLTVVANGPYLACYINGTLVWNGQDTSLTSGRVGVGLYVDSSAGNELRVDWAYLRQY